MIPRQCNPFLQQTESNYSVTLTLFNRVVALCDFKTAIPVQQYIRRLLEIQQARKQLQNLHKETAFH
jgi:hypothetical protein